MQNRRQILGKAAALGLSVAALAKVPDASARFVSPEGLHHQDWYYPTSFDLREDLKVAQERNKELVLVWEQLGCVYCQKMHELVYSRPDIVKLINDNFLFVQMDLRGERMFIDAEGESLSESQIAKNYVVNATPTTLFLDDFGDMNFKAPGYLPPKYFKELYQYVIDGAYADTPFIPWLKARIKT